MSVLLSLDPGIRGCGVAIFSDGLLSQAAYVCNPCLEGSGAAEAASMASWVQGFFSNWKVDEIAVEWPRIYASRIREGSSKADPNDLLALTGVGAALVALLAPARATSYVPSDWKGQLTKEATEARIRSRFHQYELEIAVRGAEAARSKAHNMFDAIGIGLHHLGRFERKRIIPT